MSLGRKLVIAFWTFVGVMLLWQFYSYNQGLDRQAAAQPQNVEYWYTNSAAHPAAPTPAPRPDGADVEQTDFTVRQDGSDNLVCDVTLKNEGNQKAIDIQINVRPYRGSSNYDEDVGHSSNVVLDDNDPVSLYGQWLEFPDLAPGETKTQSISFVPRSGYKPGKNPHPNIVFKSEKANP